MRKKLYRLLPTATVFLIAISCSNENPNITSDGKATCSDGVQNGNEMGIDCGWACSNSCYEINGLEGEIVSKVILDNSVEYKLTGPLLVRDSGELEIREGTIIKAIPGKNAYIAVTQGGKIYVYGKKESPVVITSDSANPEPGDWGGLVICGKAPTNTGSPSRSGTVDIFYGGDDPLDSSGVLRYLRVEYTGAAFSNSNIFNGISFYGVGSQTSVEHVQVYNGLGDAFAFFGGTVNSQWLTGSKMGKNAFFMTDGWNGKGAFWYASEIVRSGIKMANNKANATAPPMTTGQISDISIIGPVTEGALQYADGGGVFTLNNIYTAGVNLGINLAENTLLKVDEGNLNIAPIEFDNVESGFEITNYSDNTFFYSEGDTSGAGNKGSIPDWAVGWTKGL